MTIFFPLVSQHGAIVENILYFPESDICYALFGFVFMEPLLFARIVKKDRKKKRREKKGSTDNSGNFTLTREEEASISGVSINDKHPWNHGKNVYEQFTKLSWAKNSSR